MKAKTKHIAYSALIAIGVGWVVCDRLSTGPAPAAATELLIATSAPPAPPARQTGATDKSAPLDADESALAQRLGDLEQQHNIDFDHAKDAFIPGSAWFTTKAPPVVHQTDVNAQAFTRRHKLMSLMVSGQSRSAMIDGRLLRIGDQLDGFKVISISKEGVTFASDGSRAQLKFATPASDNQSPAPAPADQGL